MPAPQAPVILAACVGTLAATVAAEPPLVNQTVFYDAVVGPDGELEGGQVTLRLPDLSSVTARTARSSNSADNRVDIVFVGDGYTATQLGLFDLHVDSVLASLFGLEPFTAYEPYFRVHRIDVVSNESGIDNDPFGVDRDTALDMTYWCNNIERLLCVNVAKAYSFANQAPDVDQVIAVANSSKYGGAGYPFNNLGTLAGANAAAADIAIHELGHSLGDLADEYTYGGPPNYTGDERPEPNVSIYNASSIAALETKWHEWLGDNDPRFDSPVNAYEGGYYSVTGVYRPSPNSMMRALGRKFNGPSAEALIREIYREVTPIDEHTPNTTELLSYEPITVVPMQPVGHDLNITWRVAGNNVAVGSGAMTIDPRTLGFTPPFVLTATVVDPTDMVRDEAIRASAMTQSVSWSIVSPCPGDTNGDNAVTAIDISTVLSNFGSTTAENPTDGDLTGDGIVTALDISAVLSLFGSNCS